MSQDQHSLVLLENPNIGADYDQVCERYRRFSINRHRVFYRLTGEAIEIIRVLHENMDVERNLV